MEGAFIRGGQRTFPGYKTERLHIPTYSPLL